MLDWGHPWPLWENGTSKYALTPDDLDLSADLREGMRAWYDSWEREYDENMGWGTVARRDRFDADAAAILEQLRQEVGSFADVADEVKGAYR